MSDFQEGLIYTNDNCVGCNKCIGACSCLGATIAVETKDGDNVIKIDGNRCVACGACFDACEHGAREYLDDTESFFDSLAAGEDITIMYAPAFLANYPDEYESILGKLKALGVNKILSVSFGADITTWAYLNYMANSDTKGFLSQPCPALVDYIEKYLPELITKLIPVQSPMMCAAIYARKYLGVTGKIAFIGPCIAKKNEIMSERGQGIISYSVTFKHLMRKLRTIDIEPVEYQEEMDYGLGSVYSIPGGLEENVYWFLGEEAFVREMDGEKRLYEYLLENKDRILDENSPYTLIDVLNCKDGCLCGTGVEDDLISNEDTVIQMQRIRQRVKNRKSDSAWSSALTPEERLREFNRQFEKLDLNDYLCSYEDKSEGCGWKVPTDEELDIIFEDMNKTTPASRKINCSCCGYESCKYMAEAIYNGFNHKENCIHFLKDIMEGLSADCPTVMVIHEANQSFHMVKTSDESSINSWIQSGLSLLDYNTAIRDYIDRYVDDSDKERVWSEVEYSALHKNIEANSGYSTTYMRHPEVGKSGYFRLNFNKIHGRNDIVLAFQDVDEAVREERESRKRLKNALDDAKQANEAKSTFLANMSHEIRTPINAVLGMDTMILREAEQESVLEYAANIKSASNTLLSLINDILDFSKIESGKMEIINVKYRLDSVINDLMNMVGQKAADKDLTLELKLQSGLPSQMYGDEVRVKQVILNILNNAVKYTKEGGITFEVGFEEIDDERSEHTSEETAETVSDSNDGRNLDTTLSDEDNLSIEKNVYLKVAVRDTGVGIKQEDMEKLFTPYERLEENKNRQIEGTGLGISITKNLLEKMGSVLEVESVYGEGSTFSFSVSQGIWGPDLVNQEELGKNVNRQAEEQETFYAPDAKVLAVDDVEMNLTVLTGLLKRIKIKPDTVTSGKLAVEKAMAEQYDLILLDAMMPEMSGEETLHAIKDTCPLNADTPVIVLTANAVVGARDEYLKEGFNDYLSKPLDGVKLEKLIGRYLPEELKQAADLLAADSGDEAPANEQDPVIVKLDSYEMIDTASGITAAGDEGVYVSVVRNFAETADSRMGMIQDYFENSDIPNYTIQVHALKSSARLIGANDLSKRALELEMAGKDGNVELIKERTPGILADYAKLSEFLNATFAEEVGDNLTASGEPKKEIKLKKFNRRLDEFLELWEAFDFENAKALFTELDDYIIPDEAVEVYKKLKLCVAEVNRDEAMSLLKDYLGY